MEDSKKFFCSRCGRQTERMRIVWVDEEGRHYNYDKRCSVLAAQERETFLLSLTPAERLYRQTGVKEDDESKLTGQALRTPSPDESEEGA